MNRGRLTQRLIDWALTLPGHVRGALVQVSLLTNLMMAGVSGSGAADAAAAGRILSPAMRKEGYDQGYAGAVIAAGAMLGPIIPPSVPMIVYRGNGERLGHPVVSCRRFARLAAV